MNNCMFGLIDIFIISWQPEWKRGTLWFGQNAWNFTYLFGLIEYINFPKMVWVLLCGEDQNYKVNLDFFNIHGESEVMQVIETT